MSAYTSRNLPTRDEVLKGMGTGKWCRADRLGAAIGATGRNTGEVMRALHRAGILQMKRTQKGVLYCNPGKVDTVAVAENRYVPPLRPLVGYDLSKFKDLCEATRKTGTGLT